METGRERNRKNEKRVREKEIEIRADTSGYERIRARVCARLDTSSPSALVEDGGAALAPPSSRYPQSATITLGLTVVKLWQVVANEGCAGAMGNNSSMWTTRVRNENKPQTKLAKLTD